MNFLKTTNGKVALHKFNGSLIRNIGTDDSSCASMRMEDYMILITTKEGSVKMYSETGNLVNLIKPTGATSATFIDNHILVFTSENRIELWNDEGNFIKYI
jgi:primase-polymerase (primpol)-like protein